ncbi:MAG TPA: DUF1801 domain-containing protein [Burkholderiaceae bacterium]|nr:DUF1801 domain-containing protein [Burkholderiaceae bacterium]
MSFSDTRRQSPSAASSSSIAPLMPGVGGAESGSRKTLRPWTGGRRPSFKPVLLHDSCLTICVEEAPFAHVSAFKAHVNVGFFHGATLANPAGLLRGTGRFMRHVKLKLGLAIDAPALQALINAPYRDVTTRLADRGARPARQ